MQVNKIVQTSRNGMLTSVFDRRNGRVVYSPFLDSR